MGSVFACSNAHGYGFGYWKGIVSDVVEAIECSFIELVKEKPYRSISVKDICASAHVGRNTFYANFQNKRAIVASLFRKHALNPFCQVVDLLTPEVAFKMGDVAFVKFFQGIFDNRDYYTNLVVPMCGVDPTFELVVARAIYKIFRANLAKRCPECSEDEADMIAYNFAASQAIVLERWIHTGFALSVEDMAKTYSLICMDCWTKLFGLV